MQRSLSIIAAAAIAVGASAASLSPTQAAPRPAQVETSDSIIEIQNWENFHGDRHNSFRDDGWNDDGWNDGRRYHRRHHRFRNQGFHHNRPFYFGFPFAFRPQYYPYNNYHRDCFRTWEGYVVCQR
jgi:hypothetical protein